MTCDQCGECCRHVGEVLKNFPHHPLVRSFPYLTNAQGECEKLVDNKCTVYEHRPKLCNVAAGAAMVGVPMKTWLQYNSAFCQFLKSK